MDTATLEKKAIQAAIEGAWKYAIELNEKILKSEPQNIAALNRLARAFCQINKLSFAKKAYQKAIALDQYNPIAIRNLKRLTDQVKGKKKQSSQEPTVAEFFIGEPGKTKVVKLLRLTSPKILAELNNGNRVVLVPKKRFVTITKEDKTYLGILPEDLSQRLISLTKGGNRYDAFVKVVERQHLEIFIKETFRSHRLGNLPSFPI